MAVKYSPYVKAKRLLNMIKDYLFLSTASQYLANNSGDFDEVPACFVTALVLIHLLHAYIK